MCVLFTSDGSKLISPAWDGIAIVWDRKTSKQLHTLQLNNKRQWRVNIAIAPDGKTVATADQLKVQLWGIDTGKEKRTIPTALLGPACVAFSPDGKYLAVGFVGPFRDDERNNVGGIEQWDIEADAPRAAQR